MEINRIKKSSEKVDFYKNFTEEVVRALFEDILGIE